jgi:anti-sigma28 factor (negative regulator of flagellin synthesis)
MQEQLVKRAAEPDEQAGEEINEEDVDETLVERTEEARGILEKIEEIRRDDRDGSYTAHNQSFSNQVFLCSTSG